MRSQRTAAAAILACAILLALAPLAIRGIDLPIPQHHLMHALIIALAIASALLFATPSRDTSAGHYGWLLVVILAPVATMVLMWPSEYSWFELHPAGHAIEHLALVALGFATGYAGQRYAAGIGWASGIVLFCMALVAALGYGVAPAATTPTASNVPEKTAARVASVAEDSAAVARGAKIFSQNCAVCHGVAGAGGDGPSLKGENQRKNFQQAQQWIMNPLPPMPKLYPGPLNRADVRDVAAYLETL